MLRIAVPVLALTVLTACGSDAPTSQDAAHAHSASTRAARGPDGRPSPAVNAGLAQVRRATARYHNVAHAMADGYTVWSPDPMAPGATCASSPEGRMGYHLVKPALRGSPADPGAADATLDPLQPEMLLYEKRPNGSLRLVGVEYLVFQAAWEREHGAGAAPPTLFGREVPYSSHPFPPLVATPVAHYELHVWLWSDNPNGMFSHWNPSISC